MRSQKYPPTMQPTADTIPASAPVTSATVSADARQSMDTADQSPDAAPVPMGRKQSRSAREPPPDRASVHRSLKTFRRLRPKSAARWLTGGSAMKSNANELSKHAAPSHTPAIHGSAKACVSHNPAPPPNPTPPRLPA